MLSHPLSQPTAVMYIGDGPVLHYFCKGKHLFCFWEREGGWSDSVSGWHHRFSSVRWLVRVWREFEGKEWQLSGLPGSSRYHTIHQVFALWQKNFLRCLSCVFVCSPSFLFFFFSCVWYLDEFSFPCIICAKKLVFASWLAQSFLSCVSGFWLVLVGDKLLVSLYHVCIIEVHDLSSVFTKSVCTARRAAGCSWHGTRVPDAHAIRTFLYAFSWKDTRTWQETQKERMSSHSFGILMLLQFVCVCVCVWERERESQWKQSAGRTASTTQTLAKYSINTAKVCVCLLYFFLFAFGWKATHRWWETQKKASRLIALVYWGIAICACACMYHIEKKVPDEQQAWHTKPVSIRQRKPQRQRCMCHNEKT